MTRETIDTFKTKITKKYKIDKIIASGEVERATEVLFKLILTFIEQHKFIEADTIREWIIEIDPMALNTVIRASQAIEDAKIKAIDLDHYRTWNKLANHLTREEFAALYHSLVIRNYQSDKNVVNQGTHFPALLFVNDGRLELDTQSNGKATVLKTVGNGEIVGSASFFDPSTWTFSVRSLGAEVAILTSKRLNLLHGDFPSLESKLQDYCGRFPQPDIQLQTMGDGRRTHKRKRVDGRTSLTIVDAKGATTGRGVSGDLFDISRGGISCLIRSSKKKNAIQLFGRKILAALPMGNTPTPLKKEGTIVAVRGFRVTGNEYSLHVHFRDLLEPSDLHRIVAKVA